MLNKTTFISVLYKKSGKIHIHFPFSILTGESSDDLNEETAFLRYLLRQLDGHGVRKIKMGIQRLVLVLYEESDTFNHEQILNYVFQVLVSIVDTQKEGNFDLKFDELLSVGAVTAFDKRMFDHELVAFIQEARYKAQLIATQMKQIA